MGDGFHIQVDSLRKSSEGLVGAVDKVGEALTKLENTLHGYGSPWGSGLIGSLIGELYEGIHEMALGAMETNAEVMSEYAEGLDTMAADVEELESQIESGFDFFQQQLAGDFPSGQ
jgi:methyl-accepting chemotaxis protein